MLNTVLLDTQSFQAVLNKQKTQFRLPIMSKRVKETYLLFSMPTQGYFEFRSIYGGASKFKLKSALKINDFVEIKEKRTQNTITIKIINVRVQRLQDIGYNDITKEGFVYTSMNTGTSAPMNWFKGLWNSTYKKFVWETNPFVFVFDFEKVEKPC